LAHVYRTPLTLRVPALMPIYQMLGIDVPLPREVDLISIEASDLQADPGRGLFVLNSTLKNRAAYAQAWPQLTLTLTDVTIARWRGARFPLLIISGRSIRLHLRRAAMLACGCGSKHVILVRPVTVFIFSTQNHENTHLRLAGYDNIMVFPDRFRNHILPEQIHLLNVSFLVPEMRREYGGCAGNIAYNLKLLGGDPYIMATVGDDCAPYLERLDALRLPRTHVRQVAGSFTAQAFITTDLDDNQITAFHPGA